MKTSAKHFGLAVGPWARQREPKWPQKYFTLWRHSQKICIPNQIMFFECNLLDWLIRLSPWTAL